MKRDDLWEAIATLWGYMPVTQRLDIDREYPGLVKLCRRAAVRSAEQPFTITPAWAKEANDAQDH